MRYSSMWNVIFAFFLVFSVTSAVGSVAYSQEQGATAENQEPAPLTEEELEVLVAQIALYPDELIAVISGASLYPLQVIEAARFLDDFEKDNSLTVKETWDGSIVSLLNYLEILRMMSNDLDWTQELGDALAYQQKDLLIAIQQLRDEAVANGIIQTDDKMEVVKQDDNVVIRSVSTETIYVPQYEPEMLYVPSYPPTPIVYYPTPYPHYYYPGATFFAGVVTGAIWAGVVDWNDWGVWGGRWNGGDVDINCNNCFNNQNFNGKVNIKDVDWKNVDRSKISIDKKQFANIDRKNIRNNVKNNIDNSIRNKATNIRNTKASTLPSNAGSRDVRKSMQENLKGGGRDISNLQKPGTKPNIKRPAARLNVDRPKASKPLAKSRPSGPKKPGSNIDRQPKKPTGLGNVSKGKKQKVASKRGSKSMGGGARGGGDHKSVKRGGGKRRR